MYVCKKSSDHNINRNENILYNYLNIISVQFSVQLEQATVRFSTIMPCGQYLPRLLDSNKINIIVDLTAFTLQSSFWGNLYSFVTR